VIEESTGCALRGSFLIDKAGILRWEVKNGWAARENSDYKAAIAAL
jgi:alkyl hydroperoxide reductase subunit AhpC